MENSIDSYLQPIHVIAAPRTGSTFIWQCVVTFITNNTLRPDIVAAGDTDNLWNHMTSPLAEPIHGHKHNWLDCNEGLFQPVMQHKKTGQITTYNCWYDIVMTERNYIDSYLSHLRVVADCNNTFLETVNKEETLLSKIDFYRDELQYMEYLKQEYKGRILIFQYEKFINNYDYIFKRLELLCCNPTWPWKLILDDHIKTAIKSLTDRASNVKIQEEEVKKSFDHPFRLHKRHIWSNKIDYSKDILTEKNYNRLLEEFAPEKITPSQNVTKEYLRNCDERGGAQTIFTPRG